MYTIEYVNTDGMVDAVQCTSEGTQIIHLICGFKQRRTASEVAREFGLRISDLQVLRTSKTWLYAVIDFQIRTGSKRNFRQLGYLH